MGAQATRSPQAMDELGAYRLPSCPSTHPYVWTRTPTRRLMCEGLAPTKTGTPVSRLDKRIAVVDTGTQEIASCLLAVEVINLVWEKALDLQVQGMSTRLGRTCLILSRCVRSVPYGPAFWRVDPELVHHDLKCVLD